MKYYIALQGGKILAELRIENRVKSLILSNKEIVALLNCHNEEIGSEYAHAYLNNHHVYHQFKPIKLAVVEINGHIGVQFEDRCGRSRGVELK